MTDYNATILAGTTRDLDDIVTDLEGFSPSVGPEGRAVEVVITVPADTLRQATVTALALVEQATAGRALSMEVLLTADYDRRNGLTPVP